jgi:hypothetical protein
MTRTRRAIAVAVVVLALGGYLATTAPSGPRSMRDFDPHRLAGLARARAGQFRDLQAQGPDWNIIGRMLDESYVQLRGSVAR